MTISNSDLVGINAYLVVQVDGYGMDDLARITPQKQSIIDCAFHKAFDEVHGDHDGLYLSGQQIVATEKVEEDTERDVDDTMEGVEFRKRKYVYRPRKFPPKSRERQSYPPAKPKPGQHPIEEKYNIYWRLDTSGRCNMCPDDDSMEATSHSLLLNTSNNENERLALASKKDRDQRIASNFVMGEPSVNAIADAVRANLIDGSCAIKGDKDDSFEYVQDIDIYVLSQIDFEGSVTAIMASREARDDAKGASVATTNLEASPSATALLPFYSGGSSSTSLVATVTANGLFKIGLSGVDCGPWDNEDLLDMNSGLHDSIHSMGFSDKGHIIDRIVGDRNDPQSHRRYVWKCHFDIYANLDLAGSVLDDASLDAIGDALCDDLVHYGANEKFRNVIDCQLEPLTATEYVTIVTANNKAGLPVSSALE